MSDERTRALERRFALTQQRVAGEAWLRSLSRRGGDPDAILRARYQLRLIRHSEVLRLALLGYAPARRFLEWRPHLWRESSFAWWVNEVAQTPAELRIALDLALSAGVRLCAEDPQAAALLEPVLRPAERALREQLRAPSAEGRRACAELVAGLRRPGEVGSIAASTYGVLATGLHAVSARSGLVPSAARAALRKAGRLPEGVSGGALKRAGLGRGRLHWAVAAALLPRVLGEPAAPSLR